MNTQHLPHAIDTLPTEVAKALEEVLWHFWEAELENFVADAPEEGESHIFRSLVALDGWFYGHGTTAGEYVRDFLSEGDQALIKARVRAFRGEAG